MLLFSSARGGRVVKIASNMREHSMSFITRKLIVLQVGSGHFVNVTGRLHYKGSRLKRRVSTFSSQKQWLPLPDTLLNNRLELEYQTGVSRDPCVLHSLLEKFVTNFERYCLSLRVLHESQLQRSEI
jgi:hypothetical protein